MLFKSIKRSRWIGYAKFAHRYDLLIGFNVCACVVALHIESRSITTLDKIKCLVNTNE